MLKGSYISGVDLQINGCTTGQKKNMVAVFGA